MQEKEKDTARDDDRLMSLVDSALAQPSEERESYLCRECAGDSQLFEQARDYVQWEERMSGFLLEPFCSLELFDPALEPGELLEGRFRIVREVGEGGMAIVYEAVDEKLGKRIAIKCAKAGFRTRLTPEVRHATEISHPNVCKIFEIHTAETDRGEIDFITMELLDGPTLAERLRQGPLPPIDATAIANQLCLGLAEAHRNHVIHGDLKSNNIILTHTPDGVRAVITDFGLARRSASQQPTVQSGELGGAPDYMAPELLTGEKQSVSSDIYALGVILHEMAVRRRPFGAEATWQERLEGRPAPLKHAWHRVVARCLEPDPARRWASVSEIASALRPSKARLWWSLAAAAGIVAAVLAGIEYANLTAPQDTVRLAMLPFQTDLGSSSLSNGLLEDTAERLSRVKRGRTRLTMIPLSDAVQNKVDHPERAAKVLGATHTLTGTMRTQNGRALVHAVLTDARSNIRLKDWQADYRPDELGNLPVALAGVVTSTLRLPPLATTATVSPAAYVEFATGVALMQRDTGVDAALPLLERAVQEDPGSPLTHAKLAEAQILKFRLTRDAAWQPKAMASVAQAQRLNPDLVAVLLVSGLINRYTGLYDKAENDLRRALELEPGNGNAWRRLGQVYKDNNQLEEARAAFQEAIKAQPGYFKNHQDLCSIYANQANYDAAIRECQRMVQLAPDLWESHFALSLPYLNSGNYVEGEAEARAAVRLQDTSARALHGLAWALQIQDKNLEAILYFRRAIEIGPASDLLYLNLGTSLRRAHLLSDAEEAYRKGLALAEAELAANPKDGAVRSNLAYLSARLDQRSRAESEAAQARQLASGSVNVAWMLVLTYETLGDRDPALRLVQDLPDDTLRRMSRFPDLADFCSSSLFQQLMRSRHIQ
jgi:serine/threonine protein kinase/tetratricopeptide (TPR) repeat protein